MKAVQYMMAAMLAIMPAPGLLAENGTDIAAPSSQEEKKDVFQLGEIVVTATKTSINKRETGASITVITGEEMEKKGIRTTIDALKGQQGMIVSQNGTNGGVARVFMRGADSKNCMVLIDGVKVNDPSTNDGGFDFANLLSDNIERIEIVRGPQSTLYGSSALGGVINIITRKGAGDPTTTLRAECGSFATFREFAGIMGGNEKSHYSLSVSRVDTKGISQAEKAEGVATEPDKDGYHNTTVSARVGASPFSNSWITFVMRYFEVDANIDDGNYDDDPNHDMHTSQYSGSLTFEHDPFKWWRHVFTINSMNIWRSTKDGVDANEPTEYSNRKYEGTHRKAEWQHVFSIGEIDEITAGISIERDEMSSIANADYGYSEFGPVNVETRAYYAQNHLKLLKRVYFIAGVRVTDHETFGMNTDYQLSGSIIAPYTETRFKGTYATGFRAPTLYQLNIDDTYLKGNRDLRPEESRSIDAGIEQPLWGNRIIIEGGFFTTRYKDLIDTRGTFPSPSVYVNVNEAEMQGFEGGVTIKLVDTIRISGSYTYLKKADDLDKNERLIRRPKHQVNLNFNWLIFGRLDLNTEFLYAGERDDYSFDPATYATTRVTMDDYIIVNAGASYTFIRAVQFFARCENIGNVNYQNVLGYAMPGRAFYGGVKGTF